MVSEDCRLAGAVGVGADLRVARERLGWDLPSCASGLRIRLPYLQALEDGRLDDLPGNAYAVGFLRSYAGALGLDADVMSLRLKAETSHADMKPRLVFPVPAAERGLPAGAVALLGVVLAIGAYVGWYRLSGEGRLPAEVVPAIPARLAPLAEQALPLPAPARPPEPAVEEAAVDPEYDGPVMPSISPSSAAAAMPLPPVPVPASSAVGPASLAAAGAGQTVPGTGQALPGTGQTGESRVMLRARADTWFQVRDRSGQVLLNRVLHPGETWAVPNRPGLLLTTGNAGGTEIVVDGGAVIALSGAGAVRRDLPLDADAIKDGKILQAAPVQAGMAQVNTGQGNTVQNGASNP